MNIKWSTEDENFLKENYNKINKKEMIQKLGRTRYAVTCKAQRLGLKKDIWWTPEEITFLKENYSKMDTKKVAEKVSRKESAVLVQAQRLGLKKEWWTPEEITFLKENYSKMDKKEILLMLKRWNWKSIVNKVSRLKRRKIEISLRKERNKNIDLSKIKPIIDGLLLGDGHIRWINGQKTASLTVEQRVDRLEWLEQLRDLFLGNNIKCNISKRKSRISNIDKRNICKSNSFELHTYYYTDFFELRKKWYPDGKKIVPKDVDLSPISLAQWYMGDGCLHIKRWGYGIVLYTDAFERKYHNFLVRKLLKKYNWNFHLQKRGQIECSNRNQANEFLRMTLPYKIDCFDYKWGIK